MHHDEVVQRRNGAARHETAQLCLEGDDDLELKASIFNRLTANLGDDDDSLAYGSLRVLETAHFDGGAGQDMQTNLGNNSFARLTVQGFE